MRWTLMVSGIAGIISIANSAAMLMMQATDYLPTYLWGMFFFEPW